MATAATRFAAATEAAVCEHLATVKHVHRQYERTVDEQDGFRATSQRCAARAGPFPARANLR